MLEGRHPLDNPVWSALTTTHAGVAEGGGLARRYPVAMTWFGGVADFSRDAFVDLRTLPEADELVALGVLVGPVDVPADLFRVADVFHSLQLVQPVPVPARVIDAELVSLGPADAAEMVTLAARAQLGPFGPRMMEVGTFVGVRDAMGELIAMGGERCAMPGHVEISAVCTDPAHRGRGLGSAVVAALALGMHERGLQPCLHVEATSPARRVYEALGFVWRADVQVLVLEPR